MKIVTNRCYGGFGLSHEAAMRYAELKGIKILLYRDRDIERDDPALVQVVEELSEKANGDYAKLVITEIPDGIEWGIEKYDGKEWVSEKHRTW